MTLLADGQNGQPKDQNFQKVAARQQMGKLGRKAGKPVAHHLSTLMSAPRRPPPRARAPGRPAADITNRVEQILTTSSNLQCGRKCQRRFRAGRESVTIKGGNFIPMYFFNDPLPHP